MSSKQRRTAALWMRDHYSPIYKRSQRGAIVYGGGINVLAFIAEAEAKGFHVTMRPEYVELR